MFGVGHDQQELVELLNLALPARVTGVQPGRSLQLAGQDCPDSQAARTVRVQGHPVSFDLRVRYDHQQLARRRVHQLGGQAADELGTSAGPKAVIFASVQVPLQIRPQPGNSLSEVGFDMVEQCRRRHR